MSEKGSEVPKGNDSNRIDALKKQYDKLTEDWRYFNNLIWGVPTVAIAIMTGIMIGAYQNLHDGSWERIASLSIGSFFLLALTIEVIKKKISYERHIIIVKGSASRTWIAGQISISFRNLRRYRQIFR